MSDLEAKLLAAFQMECPEHLRGIRDFLTQLGEGDLSEDNYYGILRCAHTLKGAARAAGLLPVEQAAHDLETVVSSLRDEKTPPSTELILAIFHLLDLIEAWLAAEPADRTTLPKVADLQQDKGESEAFPEMSETVADVSARDVPASAGAIRLSEAALDSILSGVGEVLGQEQAQKLESQQLLRLQKELRTLLREVKDTPRLETRVESLIRLCREILRDQQSRAGLFYRTARQLFQSVSAARLVEAETVFAGFGRMVREVARAQGKQVRFVDQGLDNRVDRAVLQMLKEPLLHTLRNAVHHGIERPEQRRENGKPETGTVQLSLSIQDAALVVRVRDDGNGLKEEKIREKAREKGLAGSLEELLASPELTTATEVTDIAGRGIGLSIARQVIDALQGSFRVESHPGLGTMFEFVVPVAIYSQLLVFVSCLGDLFGLQSHGVYALLELRHEELEMVEGRQMVQYEGELIPVAELSDLISVGYPMSRVRETLSVAVLKQGDRKAAIVMDGFESCQKMMVRPCQFPGVPTERFAGTVLRPDGSVCLILNIPSLVRQVSAGTNFTVARAEPGERLELQQDWPASVLVVDDSITTRTLEKSILETHGYHVLVAVDGVEALRMLEMNKVDLVISDVEMPNLDGFGLLEKIKADAKLRDVPVVLLTSRKDSKDQMRGLDLGAEAYLVKQEFDQIDLLETVKQLI